MNSLEIKICNSVSEAPNYNENGEGIKPAMLKKAIIVRQGTEGGNDTIDLIFEDDNGQKYIAMITAALLKQVVDITNLSHIPI